MSDPIVYIVDDDAAVLDSLSLLLRSVGLTVAIFDTPDAFLESYRATPGCLLLDIRMPNVSGLSFQDRMNSLDISIPIIFITGHGDVVQCRRAFKAGAVDFLTKPVDETVLIESVQDAIAASTAKHSVSASLAESRMRLALLTPREREIMGLLIDGKTNKSIAVDLNLSLRTIESHRAKIFEKLSVESLSQCVLQYATACATP